jgi:hypothetical protein
MDSSSLKIVVVVALMFGAVIFLKSGKSDKKESSKPQTPTPQKRVKRTEPISRYVSYE